MPWRLPYWPWLMRIGLSSESRSGPVSWSASKDSVTQQRAPPGQEAGRRLRPARARPTIFRHSGSGSSQGGVGSDLRVSSKARGRHAARHLAPLGAP